MRSVLMYPAAFYSEQDCDVYHRRVNRVDDEGVFCHRAS